MGTDGPPEKGELEQIVTDTGVGQGLEWEDDPGKRREEAGE